MVIFHSTINNNKIRQSIVYLTGYKMLYRVLFNHLFSHFSRAEKWQNEMQYSNNNISNVHGFMQTLVRLKPRSPSCVTLGLLASN